LSLHCFNNLLAKFVKKSYLILLFLTVSYFCQAQRSEIGMLMGTSFYLGDLNSVPFRDAKFAGGLIYRHNFTPRLALRGNILFGKVAGSDARNYSRTWDYRERGLSFSSPITEISAQVEVNFLKIYKDADRNRVSPYVFGGAAVFSFNPQAVFNGITYDLQPIGTEGQGRFGRPKKYALTSFAIPFGIGFKANIGRYVCIGAEWGMRFTFTNYLDDVGGLYYNFSYYEDRMPASIFEVITHFADPSAVKHTYGSQRYSTLTPDWYSFAGVTVTVRIGNENRTCDLRTNVKLKRKWGRKK